jgi:hypothetical protein
VNWWPNDVDNKVTAARIYLGREETRWTAMLVRREGKGGRERL